MADTIKAKRANYRPRLRGSRNKFWNGRFSTEPCKFCSNSTVFRKIFAGVSFGMAFLTKGRNLHNVQSRCKSGTAPVKSFDLLLIRSNTCAPFCSNIWACRIPWVLVKTKGGSVQGFVRYVQKICPHVLCQAIN